MPALASAALSGQRGRLPAQVTGEGLAPRSPQVWGSPELQAVLTPVRRGGITRLLPVRLASREDSRLSTFSAAVPVCIGMNLVDEDSCKNQGCGLVPGRSGACYILEGSGRLRASRAWSVRRTELGCCGLSEPNRWLMPDTGFALGCLLQAHLGVGPRVVFLHRNGELLDGHGDLVMQDEQVLEIGCTPLGPKLTTASCT